MILSCKICGYMFEASSRRFRYCTSCLRGLRKISRKKNRENNGDKNRTVQVKCDVCGKLITKNVRDYNRTKKRGHKITCSKECTYIVKIKGHYKPCSYCAKEIWVTPAIEKQYNYCSRECMNNGSDFRHRGADHYRWRDDVTSRPYYRGSHWKMIRNRIRERDGYTCQVCGITEKELGKKMDVHHITPYRLFETDEEANVDDNLICLCPSCHHREDARIKE